MRRAARPAVLLPALVLLAGCGSEPSGPSQVVVEVGPQRIEAAPTQACVDGEGQRYDTAPPIVEVSPDSTVRLTVPESVAAHGWSVQVFDEQLQELLGEVDVEAGRTVFDEVNTSDVVPAAFYLVVVEDAGKECDGFSGAWPIGFLRAGGASSEPTTPAPRG